MSDNNIGDDILDNILSKESALFFIAFFVFCFCCCCCKDYVVCCYREYQVRRRMKLLKRLQQHQRELASVEIVIKDQKNQCMQQNQTTLEE